MICKLSISLRINRDGYFAINFEPFVSGARHKRLTHLRSKWIEKLGFSDEISFQSGSVMMTGNLFLS